MIYKGVPIPHPFIRHTDKVTGQFFGSDRKSFINELKKIDMFQSAPEVEQIPGGLDSPSEMGYIPSLSL